MKLLSTFSGNDKFIRTKQKTHSAEGSPDLHLPSPRGQRRLSSDPDANSIHALLLGVLAAQGRGSGALVLKSGCVGVSPRAAPYWLSDLGQVSFLACKTG